MAFTGKQDRNGADMGGGERVTGPDPAAYGADYSGLQAKAESVGAYRFGQQAHDQIFVTPFGTGVSGGEYSNPGGSMWEWDGGLAIADMPGEWSDPGVHANSSPNANTPANVIGTVLPTQEWL